MSDITDKLIRIQGELKAPKGQYNSFGKYNYRSAEDILESVKPLNATQGLLLTLTDKPVLIGDWHYIEATATLSDGESSITVNAYARESENKKGMDHSQITGTASSYARKYALNGLYLIDDTKDVDTDGYQNQNNRSQSNKNNNTEMATSKQVGLIQAKAMEFAKIRKGDVQKVYDALKITDLTKLSKKQASAYIKQLDTWLAGVKKGDSK